MRRLLLLSLFLLCATPAHATITVNAATDCESSAVSATTCTITVASGHFVAAYCFEGANNTSTITMSDSTGGSNAYTQTTSSYVSETSTTRSGFFYSSLAAQFTTITCTWTGSLSTRVQMSVYDVTGVATSSIEDSSVNSTLTVAGLTITSGTLTTTNANDILLFGANTIGNNETSFTPGSGYAIQSGGSGVRSAMSFQIVSATQSNVTTTMTWSPTNATSQGIFVAFKAAAAGAPPCDHGISLRGAGCS